MLCFVGKNSNLELEILFFRCGSLVCDVIIGVVILIGVTKGVNFVVLKWLPELIVKLNILLKLKWIKF